MTQATINEDLRSYEQIVFDLAWSTTRSKDDIALYTGATLLGDFEWVLKKSDNKLSAKSLLTYICYIPLSLLKIVCFMFKQLFKPWNTSEQSIPDVKTETLNKRQFNKIESAKVSNEQPMRDSYFVDYLIKSKRACTLNSLREYLYQNDLKLKGKIIKRINHRISNEDLLNALEDESLPLEFSTTKITFGNDLNNLLNEIFPEMITLKEDSDKETYITFKNDDYGFLKEKLERLYMEHLIVTFD